MKGALQSRSLLINQTKNFAYSYKCFDINGIKKHNERKGEKAELAVAKLL